MVSRHFMDTVYKMSTRNAPPIHLTKKLVDALPFASGTPEYLRDQQAGFGLYIGRNVKNYGSSRDRVGK